MVRGGEPFWLRQYKGQRIAARVLGAQLWLLHTYRWKGGTDERESERGGQQLR